MLTYSDTYIGGVVAGVPQAIQKHLQLVGVDPHGQQPGQAWKTWGINVEGVKIR